LTATIQHNHVFGDDFGGVALKTVLTLPVSGLQATFNIDLRAFFEVASADVGEVFPGDDIMEFNFFLLLAAGVFPDHIGGDAEAGDLHARTGLSNFGILGEVTNDHGFVEIHIIV
jgi:hypothetical protein